MEMNRENLLNRDLQSLNLSFAQTDKIKQISSTLKRQERVKTLYFTPDAENPCGPPLEIKHDDLIAYFGTVVGYGDDLDQIWIYKQNLYPWATKWYGYWPEFVIVKSTNWYWSFEKDFGGLCVQRSRDWNSVKIRYRAVKRTGTVLEVEGKEPLKGREGDRMQDIFRWIFQRGYLSGGQHGKEVSSCQNFSSELFDAFGGQDQTNLE